MPIEFMDFRYLNPFLHQIKQKNKKHFKKCKRNAWEVVDTKKQKHTLRETWWLMRTPFGSQWVLPCVLWGSKVVRSAQLTRNLRPIVNFSFLLKNKNKNKLLIGLFISILTDLYQIRYINYSFCHHNTPLSFLHSIFFHFPKNQMRFKNLEFALT